MSEKCTRRNFCCDTGERTIEVCYDKDECGCKVIQHEMHRFLFKDMGVTTTKDYLHDNP